MKLFEILSWLGVIVGLAGVAALAAAWWMLWTGSPIQIFDLSLSEVYF